VVVIVAESMGCAINAVGFMKLIACNAITCNNRLNNGDSCCDYSGDKIHGSLGYIWAINASYFLTIDCPWR
jgi:hypothetical protein